MQIEMKMHAEYCVWKEGNQGLDDLCPFNSFGWCHYHRKSVGLKKGIAYKGLPSYLRCQECKDAEKKTVEETVIEAINKTEPLIITGAGK